MHKTFHFLSLTNEYDDIHMFIEATVYLCWPFIHFLCDQFMTHILLSARAMPCSFVKNVERDREREKKRWIHLIVQWRERKRAQENRWNSQRYVKCPLNCKMKFIFAYTHWTKCINFLLLFRINRANGMSYNRADNLFVPNSFQTNGSNKSRSYGRAEIYTQPPI